MGTTGSADTRLAILRGNSASGKSTIAAILRSRSGPGLAVVEQDYVRRTSLREQDCPDAGFDDLVEGILDSSRYGTMLRDLTGDHRG